VVHKVLIEESAHTDIEIIIVWIDMRAGDNEETAIHASKIFQGDQILQFHDPNKLVGKIIAESLGASNAFAWDTYLFYDKGNEWKERAPAPLDWAHQLDDLWADTNHFAWDDELIVRLRKIANNLTNN